MTWNHCNKSSTWILILILNTFLYRISLEVVYMDSSITTLPTNLMFIKYTYIIQINILYIQNFGIMISVSRSHKYRQNLGVVWFCRRLHTELCILQYIKIRVYFLAINQILFSAIYQTGLSNTVNLFLFM